MPNASGGIVLTRSSIASESRWKCVRGSSERRSADAGVLELLDLDVGVLLLLPSHPGDPVLPTVDASVLSNDGLLLLLGVEIVPLLKGSLSW